MQVRAFERYIPLNKTAKSDVRHTHKIYILDTQMQCSLAC